MDPILSEAALTINSQNINRYGKKISYCTITKEAKVQHTKREPMFPMWTVKSIYARF